MNLSNPMRLMLGVPFLLTLLLGLAGCPPVDQPRPDPELDPIADFSWSATGAPLTVQFNDLSAAGTAPIRSWSWNFGDGTTTSEREPRHTYTQAGTYSVRLTVTTRLGSDSATRQVQVFGANSEPPEANFTGSPLTGTAPLTVNFQDLSQAHGAPITEWTWSFGDGQTSNERSPLHTYTTPGSFNVRLTVDSALGPDTVTRNNYVVVTAAGTPPTANFTGTPTAGNAPLTVSFDDTSTNGGAPITSWAWDFGDGATSTEREPSHTYTQPGTYSVELRVTSAQGSDIRARANYITVNPVQTNTPPVANFIASPEAGEAPLSVTFTDTSAPGTAAIGAWQWSFGDGATSTAQNPQHTYTAAGAYTVALTVTSPQGTDTRTRANYIVVEPGTVNTPPVANFSATPEAGTEPLTVSFTDTSAPGTAPITAWLWNFGDGSTSTQGHPEHTYTDPGTYTVSLNVTSAHGTDTRTRSGLIEVAQATAAPQANFTQEPSSGTAPLTVEFTDTSSAGSSAITSWLWNFGDGTTSTTRHPDHTYTTAGNYTVSLKVTSAHGTDTLVKPGVISVQPNAQAEYDRGFEVGFAVDEEYWNGYFDSWDTRDGGEIYYDTSHIPFYDETSYRAGYWDGVWFAYNDGYFVAYDYAFTIGFSEGYDLAYYPDWFDFLSEDEHVEWLDGGFSDGYNDGFSEGRIFGAVDYDEGLEYDWMAALDEYWDGTDLYIEELDLGTGENGPVILYEHGQDPHELVEGKKSAKTAREQELRKVTAKRKGPEVKQTTEDWVVEDRPLIPEAEEELDVWPQFSERSDFELALETTWLERIRQYFGLK